MQNELPFFTTAAKGLASHKASGQVLNALAPRLGNLIGGSADLAPSTKAIFNPDIIRNVIFTLAYGNMLSKKSNQQWRHNCHKAGYARNPIGS